VVPVSRQNQPVRIVTWNIEKGKRWPLLEKCLESEAIRSADILCLNEVDEGMARSGNLRIADEIASRLGLQAVFGQTFREFSKGVGDELLAAGENTTAIQGNATQLVDSARSDFPSETSAIRTSVNALASDVRALSSSPSPAQIASIASDASSVVRSVTSFTDATSSKCD